MKGKSPYRLLRVLTEAGIELVEGARPIIARFLGEVFDTDAERQEWLDQAVFAVLVRRTENAGAYITTLAKRGAHDILTAAERGLYREARGRGWAPGQTEPPAGAWHG